MKKEFLNIVFLDVSQSPRNHLVPLHPRGLHTTRVLGDLIPGTPDSSVPKVNIVSHLLVAGELRGPAMGGGEIVLDTLCVHG